MAALAIGSGRDVVRGLGGEGAGADLCCAVVASEARRADSRVIKFYGGPGCKGIVAGSAISPGVEWQMGI